MELVEKIRETLCGYDESIRGIEIKRIPSTTKYVARCLVDVVGKPYFTKQYRLRNVKPHTILLTENFFTLGESKMTFIFIHECTHAITPRVEKKCKSKYIRMDHSRLFYENFYNLLCYAKKKTIITKSYDSIKDVMNADNYKDNIRNDRKLYKLTK